MYMIWHVHLLYTYANWERVAPALNRMGTVCYWHFPSVGLEFASPEEGWQHNSRPHPAERGGTCCDWETSRSLGVSSLSTERQSLFPFCRIFPRLSFAALPKVPGIHLFDHRWGVLNWVRTSLKWKEKWPTLISWSLGGMEAICGDGVFANQSRPGDLQNDHCQVEPDRLIRPKGACSVGWWQQWRPRMPPQ